LEQAQLKNGRDIIMQKLIIEARVNEYSMRRNPHIPFTAEEITRTAIQCRKAGAAILHFHARNPDGSPSQDLANYLQTIKMIHDSCDILVLPTLGYITNDKTGKEKINFIRQLAANRGTCPDIVPLDTGSINVDKYDQASGTFSDAEKVYENSTETLLYCAEVLGRLNVKIKMTCWDVGFVRRGAAFLRSRVIQTPGYFLLHLTDGNTLTGHPCTSAGLDALRAFLPQDIPHVWTVNCMGANLLTIVPHILREGGNVAIGIGDYHYEEAGFPDNHELVAKVSEMARQIGRQVATPQEAKEVLGIKH
jgi:uncharacterized protein (DUF849 family)